MSRLSTDRQPLEFRLCTDIQMSWSVVESKERSNTSISSVFDFFPPLFLRPGLIPTSVESSDISHTSVYLSLWFALVSRSQVSLINFVASLCGAGGIQAFKTMRTLRALRPLRAMSRMQGMRVCSPPSQQTLSLALRLPWRKRQSRSPMFNPFDTGEYNNVSFNLVIPINNILHRGDVRKNVLLYEYLFNRRKRILL